ncbi:hypothetical protein [Arthrobacter bambusae]|uniref:ATP-binding protein n=1 Tax=Arthrobacter bambusae TaxID=1338426 RepID=A0AAW8DIE9_9MICC|nr:hypothetical protein [Arthrobacter bambusae]MDP9905612.1 hypothetical protein [Arthrobacter bambusae]MDQ0127306.1 hypothetical protein [Arthrobacter bambusae]MDQ0178648.1 hypothetical protein [Arthrobacter bambusae]
MIRAISMTVMTVLCSVFAILHVTLGLLSLDMVSSAWPSLTAMAIYLAATVLVLIPGPGRLPLWRAVFAVAAVVAMTLLVDGVLPKDTWPGYASWHMAATYTLLVVVNLRGRVAVSWLGAACSVALLAQWASGTTMGLVGGLMLSIATVGWLTIATGIGHLLRTNDGKVAQYAGDARAAADWYAAERALNLSRTQWLEHVRDVTVPALTKIADPETELSDADRQELRLIEAQVRDEIRGRVLVTSEVVAAARRARERGVTVQLLDDRHQELAPRMLAAVSERIVSLLNQARGGTITARVRPQGGNTTVTILASTPDEQDDPTLVEFRD